MQEVKPSMLCVRASMCVGFEIIKLVVQDCSVFFFDLIDQYVRHLPSSPSVGPVTNNSFFLVDEIIKSSLDSERNPCFVLPDE